MTSPLRWTRRRAAREARAAESLRTEGEVQDAYDRYGGELFGFAFNALEDRQLAEDVVQETFLRAWRSAGRFDPDRASLRTWLFTIARNGVVDASRRRRARPTPGADPVDAVDASAGEFPGGDPFDHLLTRIELDEALRRLSPEHRQAVVEVHFSGRTCADLAAELDVPASTMRSRLYYGVRTLRMVLEENGWLAP